MGEIGEGPLERLPRTHISTTKEGVGGNWDSATHQTRRYSQAG